MPMFSLRALLLASSAAVSLPAVAQAASFGARSHAGACAIGQCAGLALSGTIATTLSPSYAGTGDDAAIQAAINAAASGTTVVLAPGSFSIGNPITLKSGVNVGCMAGAVLKATGSNPGGTVPVPAGITVNGQTTYQQAGTVSNGIFTTGDSSPVTAVSIEGCTFDGGALGGPGLYGSDPAAIYVDGYSSNITVRYNTFQNWTNSNDFILWRGSNIYFQNNLLTNSMQGMTFATNAGNAPLTDIYLTDNVITAMSRMGMETNIASTVNGLHVDRNTIFGTGDEELSIVGTIASGTVSGNILGAFGAGPNYGGVFVPIELGTKNVTASNSAVYNVTSEGNQISDTTWGYSIGPTVTGLAILNNTFINVTNPFGTDGGFDDSQWIGANTVNGKVQVGWTAEPGAAAEPALFAPSAAGPSIEAYVSGPHASTRRHMMVCCDSFEEEASTQADLQAAQLTAANLPLLNSMLGLPWYFDPQLDNFGVGGGDLVNFFAQLGSILARQADYMILGVGHNAGIGVIQASLGGGASQSQAIAALTAYLPIEEARFDAAVQTLLANGTTPIVVLEPPFDCDALTQGPAGCASGSGTTYLPALLDYESSFNVWKQEYAARHDLPVWDWWGATVAQQGVTIGSVTVPGMPLALTDDLIHPNNAANQLIAARGVRDLATLGGSSIAVLPSSTLDLNSPTNPEGNLIPNGLMVGTYTYDSAPYAGTFANGWGGLGGNLGTGKVITGSVNPARGGIGNAMTFAVSGTGTAGNSNAESFSIGASLAAAGQNWTAPTDTVVSCYGVVEIAANSPFTRVALTLVTSAGNSGTGNDWGSTAGIAPGVSSPGVSFPHPVTYTVEVPPTLVKAGAGAALFLHPLWNDAAGTFTGSFSLSQVKCAPQAVGAPF